jgi:hypothetical protein
MLVVPAVLLIALCFLSLASMAGDPQATSTLSGPSWLGAVILPVPAALVVMAEYRAIRHRNARAAARVTGLCFWFPAVGSVGWFEGLLSLTGVLSRSRGWGSWAEFGLYSAFLAYMGISGLGHLRWWRVLRASKPAGSAELNVDI